MNRLAKRHYIYFAQAQDDGQGRIKIGCSYRPAKRLEALSIWSPYPIKIIAVAVGDFAVERQLHAHFAADRLHREWFRYSSELMDVIHRMSRGATFEEATAQTVARAA